MCHLVGGSVGRVDADVLRHSIHLRSHTQPLGEDDEERARDDKGAEEREPVGVELDGDPVRAQEVLVKEGDVVDQGRDGRQEQIHDGIGDGKSDDGEPPATPALDRAGPNPQAGLEVHDHASENHHASRVPDGGGIVEGELQAVDGDRGLVLVERTVLSEWVLLDQPPPAGLVSSEAVHGRHAVGALLDQKLAPEPHQGAVEDEDQDHEENGHQPRPDVSPVDGVDVGLAWVLTLG